MAGRAGNVSFLDMSSFTDNLSKFELIRKTMSNALAWDVFGGKTKFRAVVLSPPILLAAADADLDGTQHSEGDDELNWYERRASGSPGGSGPTWQSSKFAFKARILGNPSPHDFLQDPCEIAFAENPQKVMRLISLHTTFISGDDLNTEETSVPKIGDVVNVKLTPDDFSYNLQFGTYTSIATATTAGLEGAPSGVSERLAQQAREAGADVPAPAPGGLSCFSLGALFVDFDAGIFASDDGTRVRARSTPAPRQSASTTTYTPPSNVTEGAGSLAELLDFIARGEGGYNSMNQGTRNNRIVGSTHNASTIVGKNLTDMTITELMGYQARSSPTSTDPLRVFAAGRYQIIPSTMEHILPLTSGVSGADMFSPANQDKLAEALIYHNPIREELKKYLRGESDNLQAAHLDLAREWASVPHPTRVDAQGNAVSNYGSGNVSSHTVAEVQAALIRARNTGDSS
jgi:muramidase (phage lysozyme)